MIGYVDLESAPEYETYDELPDLGKQAFEKKFGYMIKNGTYPDFATCYPAEASFHAEFSKIVCISLGTEILDPEGDYFFIKGFTGEEIEILAAFAAVLIKIKPSLLCAHNGKVFDYPFMRKRYIKHRMEIPELLNTGDLKPWNVPLLDTMELWRGTDLKSYASLITLCYALGIESPKGGLDGSMVMTAFYAGKITEIKDYCNLDVLAEYRVHKHIERQVALTKIKMV
ncbi:MAG: ribonuclease H-like domain-containing protein [Chryseolinea sp.]